MAGHLGSGGVGPVGGEVVEADFKGMPTGVAAPQDSWV